MPIDDRREQLKCEVEVNTLIVLDWRSIVLVTMLSREEGKHVYILISNCYLLVRWGLKMPRSPHLVCVSCRKGTDSSKSRPVRTTMLKFYLSMETKKISVTRCVHMQYLPTKISQLEGPNEWWFWPYWSIR